MRSGMANRDDPREPAGGSATRLGNDQSSILNYTSYHNAISFPSFSLPDWLLMHSWVNQQYLRMLPDQMSINTVSGQKNHRDPNVGGLCLACLGPIFIESKSRMRPCPNCPPRQIRHSSQDSNRPTPQVRHSSRRIHHLNLPTPPMGRCTS